MSRLKPTSCRAQAERHLREMDRWVSSADLAKHLAISRKDVTAVLSVSIARGAVERSTNSSELVSWRYVGEPDAAPRFTLDWPPGFVSKFNARDHVSTGTPSPQAAGIDRPGVGPMGTRQPADAGPQGELFAPWFRRCGVNPECEA